MKCSVCGCEKMYKVMPFGVPRFSGKGDKLQPAQVEIVEDTGECSMGRSYIFNFDCFACSNCRHIDFYAKENAMEIAKEQYEKDEETKKQLRIYEAEKADMEETLERLSEELVSLTVKSQDENITIKQQKEIFAQIEAIKDKIKLAKHNIEVSEKFIKELENRTFAFGKKMPGMDFSGDIG